MVHIKKKKKKKKPEWLGHRYDPAVIGRYVLPGLFECAEVAGDGPRMAGAARGFVGRPA